MRSMRNAGLSLLAVMPVLLAAAASDPGEKWVSFDPKTNTVTFQLEAGTPGGNGGPFNFDGYGNGGATLVVPRGSKVVMNFVNHDGTPHSAEIIADKDPMSSIVGDPAIPGAYTSDASQGLPQGGTDVITFTAPDSGSYRIVCAVPGHAASGMWIRLSVDPAAKMPALITGK